ncbi:hypothetical protein ASZ90_009216 [hydrocarbon metagenome]|uniref:ATPase domain-containing protein n=1 Tax=hydrocarbon metagenome TaxID=938273 RepID=A0A0W8FJF6_9ZZZZ|nr:ATP-binding protein [Methanomicrobiaceae archaeon]
MENPFVFGEPVRGGRFIDREAELDRLKQYLKNSRNVIIYSPRKYGKTSLVIRALEDQEEEMLTVFIDCYAITSVKELAKALSRKVLRHYREKELFEAVKRLFLRISPRITIRTMPEILVEVEYAGEEEWEESFELPQRLATDKQIPVAVVFDEFQELAQFESLLKSLRTAFQHHNRVAYVFIGSRRHMMEWIFQAKESPFYNFGAHMTLREIPKDAFSGYILSSFAEADIAIAEDTVDALLALSACHPHYTQRLCFDLWYRGKIRGEITQSDLDAVLGEVIADLEDSYLTIWGSLTPNQKKVLLAVAQGEGDLFSGTFVRAYDFRSPASVQSALRKLIEKEIVAETGGTYRLSDIFMGYWLKQRFVGEARLSAGS